MQLKPGMGLAPERGSCLRIEIDLIPMISRNSQPSNSKQDWQLLITLKNSPNYTGIFDMTMASLNICETGIEMIKPSDVPTTPQSRHDATEVCEVSSVS